MDNNDFGELRCERPIEIFYHVTKQGSRIDETKKGITWTLRIGSRIYTIIPDSGFDLKACKILEVNHTSNFY